MIWPTLMKALWRTDAKKVEYRSVSMVETSCVSDDDIIDDDIDSVSMQEFRGLHDPSSEPLLAKKETNLDIGKSKFL